jgi:FkbM family methyltransferase
MKFANALVSRFLEMLGVGLSTQKSKGRSLRLAGIGFHKILGLLRASPHAGAFNPNHKELILSNFRSQLGQDVFALSLLGPNKQGFFVEFGATNGIDLSNSYLLETCFGWNGILCEPAVGWKNDLIKNRTAVIDARCVFSESNLVLSFSETTVPELSALRGFGESDEHSGVRQPMRTYEVKTVSLLDLLKEHDAPPHIDLLSIDTEGSEFEILKAFDFSQYTFGAICVEHNYTISRDKVRELLVSNGYRQVFSELSDFDDWFVPSTSRILSA